MPYLFTFILLLCGQPCLAACGDSEAQCLSITGNTVKQVSCSISQCANIHGGLLRVSFAGDGELSVDIDHDKSTETITLDTEVGFSIPSDILKENLRCYSTKNLQKIYCIQD